MSYFHAGMLPAGKARINWSIMITKARKASRDLIVPWPHQNKLPPLQSSVDEAADPKE